MKFNDGIHPAIDRDTYDGISRVHFSVLKAMARSPAHYRQAVVEPSKDTDPKRLGRAVHLAVFEPERFRASIAVWDGAARRGKDWELFCVRNAGKELLTIDQHEKALAIQRVVRGDATAAKYLQHGRGEVTLIWTAPINNGVNGGPVHCKGRCDFIGEEYLPDLKSCRDASPGGFGRQAASLHYFVQSAWYGDAIERLTGKRLRPVLIAIESEEPFVTQVYIVTDAQLTEGRRIYGEWLDRLAYCQANSVWPGYREGETDLELPRWILPDDDVSGLDLEIGGKTHGQGLQLEE